MEQGREHIIDLVDLEFGFGRGKGDGLSLAGQVNSTACSGELIAVMGRNGTGKSTLLRTIAGLMPALKGEILIFNRRLSDYHRKELARIMGYVSTEVVRVPGLSVEKLVALGRYPHTNWLGKLNPSDHEAIESALDLTSLQALRDRDLDELSDGERQRAMIARTLAQDTQILLLDEPTAFLDISHRYEIIDLLGNLALAYGKTVIYSTHDLQIALRQADKIWLIHTRQMLEGAPEDLVLSGRLSDALGQTDSGTKIEMDPQSGEFAVKRMLRQDISLSFGQDGLSGQEGLMAWTKKALERNGFRVTENRQTGIHVLVELADGSPRWTLEKSGRRIELNSIYDLSLYLRSINQ
jgi:iron complex transport system ATP-binding protein